MFFEKMRILNLDPRQQELIKNQIISKESEQLRQTRDKPQLSDFESVKIVGRGAFG